MHAPSTPAFTLDTADTTAESVLGEAALTQIRGLPSRGRLLGLSDRCREAPVFTERTSVGLDVHARSVAAAAIDGVTGVWSSPG